MPTEPRRAASRSRTSSKPRTSAQSSTPSRSRTTSRSAKPVVAIDTADVPLRFEARLLRPVTKGPPAAWLFLMIPVEVSRQFPSRGLNSVSGTLDSCPFQATLQPDGQGGHWLQVEPELASAARVRAGDVVPLEIRLLSEEPEPRVPEDVQQALDASPPVVQSAWTDITPMARRDWIHWITSAKKAETRQKRLNSACDMLAKGKRRPCCFDRSGMYSQSLQAPVAACDPEG